MKKKNVMASLFISGLVFILSACGDGALAENQTTSTQAATTTEETANGTDTCVGEGEDIVIVFYPNESGAEFEIIHREIERLVCEATGRPGRAMPTTDYVIAIEAIANGTANLAYMGPTGYIVASNRNPNVRAMKISSGPSGTLEDAVYYSFLAVREEDAHLWEDGQGGYDLSLLEGEIMSFVALTSTSGFVVPTIGLASHGFLPDGVLAEDHFGISGPFFSEVMMAQSHQASAFALVSGDANVAAFFNMESHFEHHSGPVNDVGMVYAIRQDADAPLDSVGGELMRVIMSISVPNAPFVANHDTLTDDEVEAIIERFLADDVTHNENFFSSNQDLVRGFFTRTDQERFLRVPDGFFDDLR